MTEFLLLQQLTERGTLVLYIFLTILFTAMLGFAIKMLELAYIMRQKKPFFIYRPFLLRKISPAQKGILKAQFKFYNKLTPKLQRHFEHRLLSFIHRKDFVGRETLQVTEEMEVLIAATAVMLTFGFRNYAIGLIDRIFIYPGEFYSTANENYHKGEFNPKLKTLVLSWKDFKKGFENETDNINLGIHEFSHAIHLNSMKRGDVSATIFSDGFKELRNILAHNDDLRQTLLESRYFRDYAFTNQYEFLAVTIETFIESPTEFRSQFPQVYAKTKQMLNFNFAGY